MRVALVVRRGFGERAIERGLLWCFAEGVQPCKGAIFDIRDGQMADRLVVGKIKCPSCLYNRITGNRTNRYSPLQCSIIGP